MVDGDPEATWSECRVFDISVIGVGVELHGPVPQYLIGQRLVIEANTPAGSSVSVRLRGEVRNTGQGPRDGTRVGMEFVELSETERQILHVMELLQVAW
jgi:hypothetical protein